METTLIKHDDDDIAARLMSHLQDEEQALAMLLVAVRELRQALLTRDGEMLTQALQAEAGSFQLGATMREKRQAFQNDMAERLQVVPDEITMSRLDQIVSADARIELAKVRQRLQDMSDELLRLNRQNAAMIQQTLNLTDRIVGHLTGGPHFTGYNATGHSEPTHVGPVLQWGG